VGEFVAVQQRSRAITESNGFCNLFRRMPNFGAVCVELNRDRLIAAVAARVLDRRVLHLIRGYLTDGVLDGGVFEESREGTPQGSACSAVAARSSPSRH